MNTHAASAITSPSHDHRPLGEILLQAGLLGDDQLRTALLEQTLRPRPLGRILVELGFITDATLRDTLSARLGQRTIDLQRTVIDTTALACVPETLARTHKIVPLHIDQALKQAVIASCEAYDLIAIDALQRQLGTDYRIEVRLAAEPEIRQAIDQHYGHTLQIDDILHEIETGSNDGRSPVGAMDKPEYPVVRLIDALLADAVKQGASDLHFEPEAGFLRIRYRIDGLLRQIRVLHHSYWPAMAIRIKILAGLNIAENRAPQDGRMVLNLAGRPIDFRVSAHPTLHGENIVLRILDRHKGIVDLDTLGLTASQLTHIGRMIRRPEGLTLITGPTGSGKTTTLYALLRQLDHEHVNIMTLEDPVEYPMPRVRQTSMGETARIDFASGVRAMLRQDPDIILIGEIRDSETAEMALRAAMTGHQVFSTLHTRSAIGAIARLLDLGLHPDILASNLSGVIGQRLIRRLCPDCSSSSPPTDQEHALLVRFGIDASEHALARANGCARCGGSGFRGRLALLETLTLSDTLEALIATRASAGELAHHARSEGFVSLAEDGLRRVMEGVTTLDEVGRVLDLTRPRAALR